MAKRHIVDGSNLATEGRSLPSLAQLDEAVRAYRSENAEDDDIIVVVDASFSYRIDESERQILEEAEAAGEIVSPPAGAVGRGDGFLLRIADRTGAVVLSNDSFQEFHGEYKWLFDEGRLVGGKPVPGVGWIFTPRTPVRGPKSRVAVRDAERARKKSASKVETEPVAEAIAEATAEAIEPDAVRVGGSKRGPRRRGSAPTPEAVNDPLPFITFIAEHRLGSEVEGTVESFTSHGAFVQAGGARCYAPVVGLGDPPPRSAKEVLTRGEARTFVVQALDAPRRGIELALPGLARVAGAPTEETVEAEIDISAPAKRRRRGSRPAIGDSADAEQPAADAAADQGSAPAPTEEPAKRAPRRRAPAKKAAEAATTAPATTEASPDEVSPADDTMSRSRTAKAPARKSRPRKTPAATEQTAGDLPAEEAAPPAKKSASRRKAAPTKTPAEKVGPTTALAEPVAKKTVAKKTVAKKTVARKTVAKKSVAKKTVAEKSLTKSLAKDSPAKESPATKSPAKKAPAKRATGTTRAAKKMTSSELATTPAPEETPPETKPPGKATATRSAAKKTPAKKTPAKKAAAKKSAADSAPAPASAPTKAPARKRSAARKPPAVGESGS